MALYAIGDTHLSLSSGKPMDVFGGGWTGYVDKLKEGFSQIRPEDTVVLCGDLSWAMGLEEAREDFAFLNALPGKKLLMKGNHDYWWNTAAKMERFFQENGFTTFHLLHNNCHFYGDIALCGTRGWFYEEDREGHGTKIFNRELIRLEASLKAGGEKEKFCFLHYPPLYQGYRCQEIIDLMERYGVTRCYYGHLHGGSHRLAASGKHGGIEYHLVSADYLGFRPEKLVED
ncbi:metallophosphoesterase [Lawsonibacter sp. OA9]|jgi:predicted phosphohydrolase|uniref:Metallophosphoesterase n=1 Tax=Flintibacter hominis TaxID=2763048 RepID=A0A8J6M6V9_9FIRM|nr:MULTISPECIES: metallophosphoesterase [Eubacteriales]MBS5590016.1 metallophosphoesterase [Clostridiales bacterium]SCH75309.1 Predicted phosphoesterase or phosphohydrolase [uncultured Clostridium sp.]SCJ18680.1 Predicted phosphoesterase or phosphohydrolase [uncultured Flavonifractor sp.]MBC5722318.1 metallophosphoesterase [Flintibacter hominis]MCH1979835.1 metallophosphoesterase [Lawsonibacter sp. OA9]